MKSEEVDSWKAYITPTHYRCNNGGSPFDTVWFPIGNRIFEVLIIIEPGKQPEYRICSRDISNAGSLTINDSDIFLTEGFEELDEAVDELDRAMMEMHNGTR